MLNSKVENVSQKDILLHNAKTCLEWSEKYMFLQCKKSEGSEDIPSVPRKGCCHAVEQANWQLLEESDMAACRGPREPDASVVAGTLSHYHFRFIAEGKLQMRWMSCPCRPCLCKDWTSCANTAWVGMFRDVEQKQIGAHGYGIHNASKKAIIDGIVAELQVGDVVAIYTSEDDRGYKYWLARVEQCAWILPSKYACAISGDKFDEGLRVLKITYFDREGGDRTFRHNGNLGIFTICSSLLRARGIVFDEQRGRRHALPLCDQLSEVNVELDDKIKATIMHDFKDS